MPKKVTDRDLQMSRKPKTPAERSLLRRRRLIASLFEQDKPLSVFRDLQNRAGVREHVNLFRGPEGKAHVRIEHFHSSCWDDNIGEWEKTFESLNEALEWTESEFGIRWVEFKTADEL